MPDCGNCAGCQGCGGAMELTEGEIRMLELLGQIPFLPVVRKMGEDVPVYPDGRDCPPEEYSLILQCLEKRGLISIDYDKPLRGAYANCGSDYPICGSFALTSRGQRVMELLEVQGVD